MASKMTAAEALVQATRFSPGEDPLDRLRALGFVIVPVEATEALLNRVAVAICVAYEDEPQWWPEFADEARAAYAAMVAPDTEKGKG